MSLDKKCTGLSMPFFFEIYAIIEVKCHKSQQANLFPHQPAENVAWKESKKGLKRSG